MKRSKILILATAALCSLFFASAVTAQPGVLDTPLKVTLNLRLKVDGNIAAINGGVLIRCTLTNALRRKATYETIVIEPGSTFVPQTPDGYIQRKIIVGAFDPQIEGQEGAFSTDYIDWFCQAVDMSNDQPFLNHQVRAVSAPADIGTCSHAWGLIYNDERTRKPELTCGAVRAGR